MKKKQIFLFVGLGILIIAGCLLAYFMLKDNKKEEKKKENEVVMYVKINPLVKLVYTEVYEECTNDNGEKEICNFVRGPIKDFELVNNDAKDIYNNLDFKGKEVFDVLTELCDTARENHVGFKSMEITSNSKYISKEIIAEEINKNSKYETTYEVLVDFKEYVEDDKTISDLEEKQGDKLKAYTVSFDTDGGSNIKQQSILENDLVGRPTNPTKEGFEFVEWQLDGKAFKFTTKVTKDITLKAKWKEVKAKEENKTENETKPTEADTKPTEQTTQVKKYTVKFDANGGSKVANQTVEENKTVSAPKEPTRKYYEFVEWQLGGTKFDFDTPITKNITLKAIWKEKAPELEKINLNDNILIYEGGHGTGAGGCGSSAGYYLVFASNLDTLFPGKTKDNRLVYIQDSKYDEVIDNEWEDPSHCIKESEWDAKKSQITYNTTKENSMISTFKAMQSDVKPGTTKLQYTFENHNLISASYGYITLADPKKFPELDEYLTYTINKQNSKFNSATKGLINIYPWGGGCGDMPGEQLLDETLCKEYNLSCGRW